jgi:hypothetical protein
MLTLVVTLCQIHGAALCVEEIVTDSNIDPTLNAISCQVRAQQSFPEWIEEHPKYIGWRVAKWKCVTGKYVIPNDI